MSARRTWAGAALALVFCLIVTSRAAAEPGPIDLVSKTSVEQAVRATAPALSEDGSFVAFEGVIGGLQGVFRENLQTGEVVSVSTVPYPGRPPATAGMAPSISTDGRYVAFTTEARLDPVDDHGESTSDVYVADMATTPPTYELASAVNGSSQGLAYEGSGGSLTAGRVALSADGREVAFVTTAPSDLAGEGTPAGQVVLRNLSTRQTTLVSVTRDPITGEMTEEPVPGGAATISQRDWAGAAISADGSTVAWLGAHIASQVPLLTGEAEAIEAIELRPEAERYDEPLWRRVGEGPKATTMRVTGGAGDSQALGCPAGGSLAVPACRGAFPEILEKVAVEGGSGARGWLSFILADGVPALSADGRTVALLGDPTNSGSVNLFVVKMAEGLSRQQAVTQLTREVVLQSERPATDINEKGFLAQAGHLFDFGISADGSRIAFATARQQFPLAPPFLIGSPPSAEGLVELYMLDLRGETIQRLTHGDGGVNEPSLSEGEFGGLVTSNGAGATNPSLSADGETVAFASNATNLVAGDGNEGSDVFTVEDPRSPVSSGTSTVAPRAQQPPPPSRWRLTLTASSLPSGKVRLVAVVPAPGAVRAQAGAVLSVGHKARRVGSARKRAGAAGRLVLTLALPRRLQHLSHAVGGLTATARVAFSTPHGKPLKGRLQIQFRAHRGKHKGHR
jgi:Tol biopolymer transport system component